MPMAFAVACAVPSNDREKVEATEPPLVAWPRSVATPGGAACAVANGELVCWGFILAAPFTGQAPPAAHPNDYSPTHIPLPVAAQAVVMGGEGAGCVLLVDGELHCWGRHGPPDCHRASMEPTRVDLPAVVDVAIDGWRNCALLVDGQVRCWSAEGGSVSACSPAPVLAESGAPLQDLVRISTAAGLDSRGRLFLWGPELFGVDERGLVAHPVRELVGAVDFARSDSHSCALTRKGEVLCWANRTRSTLASTAEVLVDLHRAPKLSPVSALACSERRCAALTRSGTLHALFSTGESSQKLFTIEPGALSVSDSGGCVGAENVVTCWGDAVTGADVPDDCVRHPCVIIPRRP